MVALENQNYALIIVHYELCIELSIMHYELCIENYAL